MQKLLYPKVIMVFLFILSFTLVFMQLSNITYAYNSVAGGLDISGVNNQKAIALANKKIKKVYEELDIKVVFEAQEFTINKTNVFLKDFEEVIKQAKKDAYGTGFFDKLNIFKNRSTKVVIPHIKFFSGIDEIVASIKTSVERQVKEPQVTFKPNAKNMFTADDGIIGIVVNQEEFYNRLMVAFNNAQSVVSLPVVMKMPDKTGKEVVSLIKKRASFSTNYSSSVGGRRHNVLISLSAFDGVSVMPNEKVSFNQVLDKIPASQFKVAKIIVNGEFVDGKGGGMCQASTTLYNALLLADLQVLESYSHSLPVGYVKFGFDAMVNPPGADLVFLNSTTSPIYIKTYGNNDDCFVEIFGEEMPKGLEIKRKSESIRTLKHNGDKVIPDVEGKFSDKILFKGEFHRTKYPQDGYEARSYLQYFLDGELVEEKYLRYSRYNAQQGVVYEGVEPLLDGFDNNLQPTSVKALEKSKEQEGASITEFEVEEIIQKVNPSHYNP